MEVAQRPLRAENDRTVALRRMTDARGRKSKGAAFQRPLAGEIYSEMRGRAGITSLALSTGLRVP
jgi:hypothetical protein